MGGKPFPAPGPRACAPGRCPPRRSGSPGQSYRLPQGQPLSGPEGRNTPASLIQEYYDAITAPDKDLIWFEHSAHGPLGEEPENFKKHLREKFLTIERGEPTRKRLPMAKIFALCLGDMSRGLIGGIITSYLLTFLIPANSNTTLPRFFLNAALTMAVIRGIGTVIDAITDPWVASLSDNCKSPLGRRVVFMRWAAIPYGLFCLLVFFPPVGGTSAVNAVWVGVMLILHYLFSTLYNIPYSALQAEIVAEPEKRVFLYTINSLFYVISPALVFCTSMIKSILISNGIPEIWALRIPFIAFCVLGAASALIPAFIIKGRDYVAPSPATGCSILPFITTVQSSA